MKDKSCKLKYEKKTSQLFVYQFQLCFIRAHSDLFLSSSVAGGIRLPKIDVNEQTSRGVRLKCNMHNPACKKYCSLLKLNLQKKATKPKKRARKVCQAARHLFPPWKVFRHILNLCPRVRVLNSDPFPTRAQSSTFCTLSAT